MENSEVINNLFTEVFPKYEPDERQKALLKDVRVTRIARNPQWTKMSVLIDSPHLIEHKDILAITDGLTRSLLAWRKIDIVIKEHFSLSDQYTPKSLYDLYENSIRDELKDVSRRLYYLFEFSEIIFISDNVIMLRMSETLMASLHQNLIDFLKGIFCDRCGLDVDIRKEFFSPEEDEKRKTLATKNRSLMDSEFYGGQISEATQRPAKAPLNPPITSKSKKDEPESRIQNENKVVKTKKNYDPDLLYGKEFDISEVTSLDSIEEEDFGIVVHGMISSVEERVTKKGDKLIFTFVLTDFTDSIKCKMFPKIEDKEEMEAAFEAGSFVYLKGSVSYDSFDKELSIGRIIGAKRSKDFRTARMDNALEKRVELHCHTKMSDMDGVSDVKDIIKCAKKWGHKALAITDHGVVQAFPDANNQAGSDPDFKVIYGCEGYMVDDLKDIITNSKGQSLNDTYVVFDIETTGFSPVNNRIIEIGAVKVENGKIVDRFSSFVNPKVPIPYRIEELTSINDRMVEDAPEINVVLPLFMDFCRGSVLVAHNADFDTSFIRKNCENLGLTYDFTAVDTLGLARVLLPNLKHFKLHQVAKELKVNLDHHHRAVDDAECTAGIFIEFKKRLEKREITNLDDINALGQSTPEMIKKLKSYHIIILAKNDIGRINLYRLVSESHLNYFNRRPLIPKSLIMKHREGLILGSACEAGELYSAVFDGATEPDIIKIARFYDYLEVQPVGNNMHLVREEKTDSVEGLRNINRQIVALADRLNKPCVATSDAHFIDPEDEIYRRIILAGQKFSDADDPTPLYLRTTEEMLEEFSYLGREKAYEIVVKNTNLIADMCEKIKPIRPDKCPPVIENSDEELRRICYDKAHSMYGDPLPEVVQKRLDRELTSIIGNGYAVMYIIAQKLVDKSMSDGYLVGSRGSVGSSFVATMSGITEVNPLAPHYYCPNCHYSDFTSDLVKSFAGGCGCDMPDMDCPECGEKLKKDGFDIPFETFLGFKGNKEPDIDLNFSGEYQAKAHKYTEVIFGKGQTFKAGTIGTLADKTAYGFVKNYFEERNNPKRGCEIDRIVKGCVGIRRTTGQHPGGIVVLPHGEEIHTFTPVQYPANKAESGVITTHFDYHKIEHNLLKLDILGHDDPTMIRFLEDVTGVKAQEIPLDDEKVMSLFDSPAALGVTREQLEGVHTGTLGVPEFGTENVINMLKEAKPKSFGDLVRISGLSHGTDVWAGNAEVLIKEGIATISTAICTRDDIMTYLIGMGLDNEESFKIMEAVRKGKVAGGKEPKWDSYRADMEEHGVPEWYIESCRKIQYMFPRAHAAAYVMMGWRIAWFKVYYPLEYYAAYFSIRATSFDYELMALGEDRLKYNMAVLRRKDAEKTITAAEKSTLDDMKNVLEMYERGYEFEPIDIYKAKAHHFQVTEEGKLMPALGTLSGMGPAVAEAVEEAAKEGPFLSQENFKNRTKASKTTIELMDRLGLLGELPESNQISIFDLFGDV